MKDKELTPIQELVLRVVKIAQDLGLKGLTKEQILQSVETLQPLIAQERRKAKIEVIEEVSNRLDDLHQGTEGAGWVHYGEMGEWLDDRLAELKEDKEA